MTDTAFRERYGPAALVTVASSGIGLAFAEDLASRGLDLLLVARRVDRLRDLAQELGSRHRVRVEAIEADLARADAPARVADAAGASDVGLIVSNAGFSVKGAHADADAAMLTDMLMVNCHAPLQLTRMFIPRLQERRRGGIILTSSVEGLLGCPYSGAYAASKALVKSLGEALWAELREQEIDVLTICPGATDTEGLARSGYDATANPNVMAAADVAAFALDRIADGPTLVCGDHYRAMFERLSTMPRRDALLAMAASVKPAAPRP